jgi:zinc protease
MAGLIEEGAGELDAVGFSKARDDVSARFGFSAGRDSVDVSARMLVETLEDVSARMLVETLEPSIALLATALASPRFDPEPLERVRAQVISMIAESGTKPNSVAAEAWYAGTFPDHPYGRPTDGTADSVAAITRDDLVAAHARLLTRANARISVVGAIGAEQAGRMVDTVLAGVAQGTPLTRERVSDAPPPGLRVIELGVPQSAAVFGHAGLGRDEGARKARVGLWGLFLSLGS